MFQDDSNIVYNIFFFDETNFFEPIIKHILNAIKSAEFELAFECRNLSLLL